VRFGDWIFFVNNGVMTQIDICACWSRQRHRSSVLDYRSELHDPIYMAVGSCDRRKLKENPSFASIGNFYVRFYMVLIVIFVRLLKFCLTFEHFSEKLIVKF